MQYVLKTFMCGNVNFGVSYIFEFANTSNSIRPPFHNYLLAFMAENFPCLEIDNYAWSLCVVYAAYLMMLALPISGTMKMG